MSDPHAPKTWNMADYHDESIGPSGVADAFLLSAICRYVKPDLALEYGGLLGHSLAVMAEHCGHVISVDDNAGDQLRATAKRVGNARVVRAKMEEYDPLKDGIAPGSVGLVFIDAAHLYECDVAAYELVEPVLVETPVLLVHDTGEWSDAGPPSWKEFAERRAFFADHDRRFVAYLRTKGYSDVTFESPRHLRHGITVLMKPPKWRTK